MPMDKIFRSILLFTLMGVGSFCSGQTYPSKPVKIIVPSAPGGGSDIIARQLAQSFTKAFGQSFFVENKPGAGNMIGIEAVMHAPADGYTLLMVPTPLILNPILIKNVGYDPIKDFSPISLAATAPNIFVVNPNIPAKNLREWINLAKKDPNKLNYSSAGVGTSPHMSMELFNYLAGIQTTHVPYKGTTPAITDLISGQVDAMFINPLTAMPYIQSGKLRALAVSGTKRLDLLPSTPSVMESGISNYVALQWYGLLAPAGTPDNIIQMIQKEMVKALQNKEIKERLLAEGAEPMGSSSEEFKTLIKNDYQKWSEVARRAKIEAQ
jgi:tripartite-type tricarboxylate transporter receptor subunit TctC